MTKAQLLAEVNRLRQATGLAPVPAVSVPARATAVPWATGVPVAQVVPQVATVAPTARVDRQWFDTGERGESSGGNPTIILLSGMKNGGFFRCTFPADAVRAIAHGKVLGADGKTPVTF